MNDDIKPTVDPWELLVQHNQRIQQLEQQVQELQSALLNHRIKIDDLIQAVNTNTKLQAVNQDTMNRLLENHTALSGLVADMAVRSTPSATGNH